MTSRSGGGALALRSGAGEIEGGAEDALGGFGQAVARQIFFVDEAGVGDVAAGAERAADGFAQVVEDHEVVARVGDVIIVVRVAIVGDGGWRFGARGALRSAL
jgi:hypothetical protein